MRKCSLKPNLHTRELNFCKNTLFKKMLQDIGLHFWNVLWKMLFRHVSVLKISDIQLRNRKCYFWTKTKWTIVIYFWIIKETSILYFLLYYNIEYTNFCLKTKEKKPFQNHILPRGGFEPMTLGFEVNCLHQYTKVQFDEFLSGDNFFC